MRRDSVVVFPAARIVRAVPADAARPVPVFGVRLVHADGPDHPRHGLRRG